VYFRRRYTGQAILAEQAFAQFNIFPEKNVGKDFKLFLEEKYGY